MLKRMGYWWVPLGSFVLAILLSVFSNPIKSAQALQAGDCEVKFTKTVWEKAEDDFKIDIEAEYKSSKAYTATLTVTVFGRFKPGKPPKGKDEEMMLPIFVAVKTKAGDPGQTVKNNVTEAFGPESMKLLIALAENTHDAKFVGSLNELPIQAIATVFDFGSDPCTKTVPFSLQQPDKAKKKK